MSVQAVKSVQSPLPVELIKVSKSYGAVKALSDINLELRSNEVLGLIGENGAGKSTLLKILGGVHRQDTGTFKINGNEHKISGATSASNAGIGVVHQEQSVIGNLTVAENIVLGTTRKSQQRTDTFGFYNWRAVNSEAERALKYIGSTISPHTIVEELSFADRQMVEIAKAIYTSNQPGVPPIIVLDEPTSVLEKDDIARLEAEVKRLRDVGSVIFVSHRLDEVLRICDRVYVMRAGRIVAERDTKTVDEDELFRLMTGRESVERELEAPRPRVTGEAAKVVGLSRRGAYSVSFTVKRGHVHAIVGTKNSGREEVVRSLFGAEDFDYGEIFIDGKRVVRPTIARMIDLGIAYVPAERKAEGMVAGMSVTENMMLTHSEGEIRGGYIKHSDEKNSVRQWLETLDIRPRNPRADIARLSGGNQQKVVLAKWALDKNLNLLILDHPTRGLDPGAREHVTTLIRTLSERGVGILLLPDTLEEAIALSHQITVMRDGTTTAFFDTQQGQSPDMAKLIEHMV